MIQQPEPKIGGHLIVPAPASVQLACDWPYQLLQPPFDGRMNVLVAGVAGKLRLLNFLQDLIQSLSYCYMLFPLQHAYLY